MITQYKRYSLPVLQGNFAVMKNSFLQNFFENGVAKFENHAIMVTNITNKNKTDESDWLYFCHPREPAVAASRYGVAQTPLD